MEIQASVKSVADAAGVVTAADAEAGAASALRFSHDVTVTHKTNKEKTDRGRMACPFK